MAEKNNIMRDAGGDILTTEFVYESTVRAISKIQHGRRNHRDFPCWRVFVRLW
jgi:hypothetical protein